MRPSSLAQKQNSLPLDTALTRYAAKKTFPKSSLSLTPFIQLRKYLMTNPTYIKSIQQPFFTNFGNFFLHAKKIPLNSGNIQAISNGDSTGRLTKIWSCSILSPYSQVNYLGITAKNPIATTSSVSGKWHSKYQMEKVETFSILSTTTTKILNCPTSKEALGSKPLVTLIHYVLMLQELLQTTPW